MTKGLISHENEGLSQAEKGLLPKLREKLEEMKERKYNTLWRNRAPEKTETETAECHSVIVKDEWDDFKAL
ncbi:hypothetical protein CEXT_462691 [Caerostris extrusa]|uniref:Uncharacterized protein n=1 Tax=Caerostris extrusa TaxID=172846 RepID=A0AAV4YD06_CAEEX|nr:hypothetical protein CEXT_462691 [Caerostris extrusa]